MVETIRDRLGRTATFKIVQGAYSNQQFKEISCVINRLEDSKIKQIIHEIDPTAFVTVYEVVEVKGGNFKKTRHSLIKKDINHKKTGHYYSSSFVFSTYH